MRLDKYLADMSLGTRSEVKELIRKGKITVNGKTVKDASLQIKESDSVACEGQEVSYVECEYYLLNKPKGYICALEDKRHPVIMELIRSRRKDLVPVGRLDLDTEGAILLTNDGQLNHFLLSPKNHVPKTYYAETDKPIPEEAPELFEKGLDLGDFTSAPARLKILGENKAELTIHEGKFHQVKRMFEKVGCTVTCLRRLRFGELTLDGLQTGEFRSLTEEEIKTLKKDQPSD
ncbi:MAG: rRNA pseudouridine synthase [Erysipelotrichaceae bacterium]|nr:rRNA pseudouridine synthase [Erysipelotrichaceae bacterium]